jgi:hypothetical protein
MMSFMRSHAREGVHKIAKRLGLRVLCSGSDRRGVSPRGARLPEACAKRWATGRKTSDLSARLCPFPHTPKAALQARQIRDRRAHRLGR